MKIRYYIRHSKNKTEDPVSIRVRLIDGRQTDLHAKARMTVLPKNWNQKDQEYKSTAGEMRINTNGSERKKSRYDENVKLRDLKSHIESSFNILEDHSNVSRTWLQEIIDKWQNYKQAESDKPQTLFQFIDHFIKEAEAGRRLNNRNERIGYKQTREYHASFDHFKKFSKSRNRKKDIDFKDIDNNLYFEFKEYLETLDMAKNTVGKKIMTLKIFLNEAITQGYLLPNYHSSKYKNVSEESDTVALNKKELDDIYKLDLSDNPSWDRVRDLFIIACWTGLRFGDWIQIEPYNIKDGMIELKQSKTGDPVVIPLHYTVKAILEKYDYELPQISNQKFNEYIKKVCAKAKINDITRQKITRGGKEKIDTFPKHELISAHTGRRSFASNLYRDGISTVTIMALTGHKSEAAFLRYIRVNPQEHAKLIKARWDQEAAQLKIV